MAFMKQKTLQKSKLENIKWLKKYANLSVDELSKKSNKNIYVKNDVMTTVIKCFRGEKKKRQKKKKKNFMDLEEN